MLKGSLQTVALPEVLNFLADTGKSGEFHLSGGRGEGRLWFAQGRISGIQVPRAQEPSEAIFMLLRVDDGEFNFTADADRPDGVHVVAGDAGNLAQALEAAETKLTEWREIVAIVPSLAHQLRLRSEMPVEPVILEPEQWMMIVAIGARRSVAEVIDDRSMQEFDGCKAVRVLVEASLVDVLEPSAETVVSEVPVASQKPTVAYGFEAEETSVDEALVEPAAAETGEGVILGTTLRFGVTDDQEAWDSEAPVEEDAGFAPHPFGSNGVEAPAGPDDSDHYAALRAAMVEVGENLGADDTEATWQDSAEPGYEFEPEPQVDGRAALHALLSEVTEDYSAGEGISSEPVDGLADRGPWTEHELSTMEGEAWAQQGHDAANIVPFAPVQGTGEEDDPTEAEAAESAEEPINRGMLLKFLSSVRQ